MYCTLQIYSWHSFSVITLGCLPRSIGVLTGICAGTYTPLHAFREAYAKARAIGVDLSDSSSSDSEDEDLMPSPRTGNSVAAKHTCCPCYVQPVQLNHAHFLQV